MRVLVIAPHADDEVLGMGGTISRLTSEGTTVIVAVMTGHGDSPHPLWPPQKWETVRGECLEAAKLMGVKDVMFYELPAACLDVTPAWKINNVVAELINDIRPSTIYIPFAFDLHKDHAAIAYAVTVAVRPYLNEANKFVRLLAYETLSETHLAPPYYTPAFQPNVFVDVSSHFEEKLKAMSVYKSQLQSNHMPRSLLNIEALARIRGAHIGVSYAEAFVLLGEYVR